ncbi:MAG TPA: ABC transporter permease, partial [Bacteroidales bacterium]|nr:ABC transporter permease [Bacteroidales bacterium]
NTIPVLSYAFRGDSVVVQNYTEIPGQEDSRQAFWLPEVVYPVNEDYTTGVSGDTFSFTNLEGERITVPRGALRKRIGEENIVTKRFLLGTDRFGRDMLSRMILGARVSLSVGLVAVFISLVIGLLFGALAGYYRGWVDDFIIWLINVIWSVPTLLLVIALTMVMGKGFWQIFIAVGITMWVEVARVVRGQVMGIREKEFVMAARSLGYSDMRIIFRHILPNIFAPVIIIAAANFASAILIEAGLSFLGIGVQPPIPSWGTMVRDHYGFIIVDKAYLAFIPGFAIMLLVLAFTLSGNGLRDAMDVRS